MSEKVRKQLPVGISDFDKVITGNYYYIDKSLFIKELLENKAEAILIPRPRRFGKTLNMSMLKCFFEKNETSKRHLFDGLKIAQHPKIMAEQGQYPIIFLTFKGVEGDIWEDSLRKLKDLIANEYRRHSYLLASSILDETQQKNFRAIISGDAEKTTYEASLQCLTEYLEAFHKKNVIVLIDEYDAPIHAGYRHKYYDKVTLFIKNFLSGGLKDNAKLQFGVITGIMRIAKESIFSGLNNLEVHAIPASFFADKFGLLETEVIELLQAYDLLQNLDTIRNWYNGYKSSDFMLYNPWSIMNTVKQHGKLEAYETVNYFV